VGIASPLWDVAVALAAALNAAAAVTAIAGADCVFADDVPPLRARPYITVDSASERSENLLMRKGHRTGIDLHLWGNQRADVMQLYAAVASSIDGVLLTLPNATTWMGALTLLAVISDPTGVSHAIAHYECASVVT
jgi:hypothetical protein